LRVCVDVSCFMSCVVLRVPIISLLTLHIDTNLQPAVNCPKTPYSKTSDLRGGGYMCRVHGLCGAASHSTHKRKHTRISGYRQSQPKPCATLFTPTFLMR
jgi:hypothetical protein